MKRRPFPNEKGAQPELGPRNAALTFLLLCLPVAAAFPAQRGNAGPPADSRPKEKPAPAPVSARAASRIEETRLAVYRGKLAEVHALGRDLSDGKRDELCRVLLQKTADEKDLGPTEWNAVKNDILDKLIAQKTMPPRLGALIVEMYRDRGNDTTWRDYCVQHITLFHQTKWPSGKPPPGDRDAHVMRSALWEAADENQSTIAGTALLGLERLSQVDASIDRGRVGGKALTYAVSGSCPALTRTTAMQVCAVMGLKDILPTARQLAQEAPETALRLSAIAAIGRLGDSAELAFLQKIAAGSSDYLVGNAVSSAILSIHAREVRHE